MAEIELQRKRGGGWWPWVLGLLALVAVIWVVAEVLDDEDELVTEDMVVDTQPPPGPVGAAPAAELSPEEARAQLPNSVREYGETCASGETGPQDLGRQHEHTARCMELAAGALDAAVRTDTVDALVLEEELNGFRSNAEELRASDPSASTHAPLVSRTMESAARLVSSLREQRYGQDEELGQAAERLGELAGELEAETPLLEQRETVDEFFREMDRALRAIARGEPAAM